MSAVEKLDPQPGDTVADLCAAPGGKSFYAACLMKNKGRIFSYDISPRIDMMAESISRLGISIISARKADARKIPELSGKADRVLVDAPCTGLGAVRRKPDIKYTKRPEDIKRLAKLQFEILSAARSFLKPGGTLLYATCTLTREENEENAAKLAVPPLKLISTELTLPDENLSRDGFFTALYKMSF